MILDSYMPVQIFSGKGCLKANYTELSKLGKKCLVVTGGSSAKKSGALDDVVFCLENLGIEYAVFNEITENPYTADCHRAGEKAREIGADFIIGIGGGSPLDASKQLQSMPQIQNFLLQIFISENIITNLFPLHLWAQLQAQAVK